MDKKIFALTLSFFSGIFLLSTTLRADLPPIDQEDDLKQKYHEAITAKQQTLEVPLLTAPSWNDRLRSVDFDSAVMPYKIEPSDNLDTKTVGNRVLRVQYLNPVKPALLTWAFEKPMDGRNQWFQMDYMGPTPPAHLSLNVKTKAGAPDSRFDVYLENSGGPGRIRFKLPAEENFSEITALSFIFEPREITEGGNDFVILNFAPLPKNADPLAAETGEKLPRFDRPLPSLIV